jgi:hypothetical protein
LRAWMFTHSRTMGEYLTSGCSGNKEADNNNFNIWHLDPRILR